MPRAMAASRRFWRFSFLDIVATSGQPSTRFARGDPRHEFRERLAKLRMLESELDRRFEIAELRATVITRAFEGVSEHVLVAQQRGNAVGELDFAPCAAPRALQFLIDRGSEDIAPHHGQRRWSVRRLWLLDDSLNL